MLVSIWKRCAGLLEVEFLGLVVQAPGLNHLLPALLSKVVEPAPKVVLPALLMDFRRVSRFASNFMEFH